MSLLRLNDFVPGTTIFSGQVDAELDQLVQSLNGVKDVDILHKFTHASNPVLNVNQLGAGLIQRWQNNSVDRATLSALGRFLLPAGVGATPSVLSTDFISNLGVYFSDPATRGTPANTNETDLSSRTLGANVFGSDGDIMFGMSLISCAGDANTKKYKLYFAGNVIFDSGAMQANAQNFFFIYYLQRLSSNSMQAFALLVPPSFVIPTGGNVMVQGNTFGSLNFATTNILKTTGQNGTAVADDLRQFGFWAVKGSV